MPEASASSGPSGCECGGPQAPGSLGPGPSALLQGVCLASVKHFPPCPRIRKQPRDLSSPSMPVIFHKGPSKLQDSPGLLSLAYILGCSRLVTSQPYRPAPPTAAPGLTSPRCFRLQFSSSPR